jgi:periplasmic mercuric ion binding protein
VDSPGLLLKGNPVRQVMMILFCAIAIACWSDVEVSASSETVTLAVKNMTCELCPITVKKALKKVPGVNGVKVDFSKKSASVEFDPEKVTPEMLVKATTNAGYPSMTVKE